MDRTVAARMRRYRLRRSMRAMLVKCLAAGICEGEVISVLHTLSSVTPGRDVDDRTFDMFERNADRRYGGGSHAPV